MNKLPKNCRDIKVWETIALSAIIAFGLVLIVFGIPALCCYLRGDFK